MKQTYQLTIEVTVDPNEISGGVRNGTPDRWAWELFLSRAEISAEASVTDCFIACCEEKIEWHNEGCESTFLPFDHDKTCVNYLSIDDYYEIEEDEDDSPRLLDAIFGNPVAELDDLIFRTVK
jgi:hypothetical protein